VSATKDAGRGAPRGLRSPILHFVIIGAVLFGVLHWREAAKETAPAPSSRPALGAVLAPAETRSPIMFPTERVERLREEFKLEHDRLPTPAELRAFVAQAVDNELLEREARRLGLAHEDSSVRLRLVQKMRAVSENPGQPEDALYKQALRLGLDDDVLIRRLLVEKLRMVLSRGPEDAVVSDADVVAFLERNRARYETPGAVTFAHVFFSTSTDAKRAHAEALSALGQLRSKNMLPPASEELSDAFPLGLEFRGKWESQLAAQFGERFAGRVIAAPVGRWIGPIDSTYGLHLVRVQEKAAGALPSLERVRAQVTRELLEERAGDRFGLAMQRLRGEYDIRVDLPPELVSATPPSLAGKP